MSLTEEEKHGLSVALNEATLLGMEVDTDRQLAAATFIKDPKGNDLSIEDFIAGRRRWWDALYQGDERTSSSGIVPLKNE